MSGLFVNGGRVVSMFICLPGFGREKHLRMCRVPDGVGIGHFSVLDFAPCFLVRDTLHNYMECVIRKLVVAYYLQKKTHGKKERV